MAVNMLLEALGRCPRGYWILVEMRCPRHSSEAVRLRHKMMVVVEDSSTHTQRESHLVAVHRWVSWSDRISAGGTVYF